MDLTPENAAPIYHLPIYQVRQYLPDIFRRLRKPGEQQAKWVQEYVVCSFAICAKISAHTTPNSRRILQAWLRQMCLQHHIRSMGMVRGWSDFEELAVEMGMVETVLELAMQPVNEPTYIAIFNGLDALCYLSTVATYEQRRVLFDRYVSCNALDTIMKVSAPIAPGNSCILTIAEQIIKSHHFNLHRYIAMRLLRSLTSDLFLSEVLSPEQAAELLVYLTRWTIHDEKRWLEQACKPSQKWQIAIVTTRLEVGDLKPLCNCIV